MCRRVARTTHYDIVVLVNGRPEVVQELVEQPFELRQYVVSEISALQADPYFSYAIQDAVRGYGSVAVERAATVEARLAEIVAIRSS